MSRIWKKRKKNETSVKRICKIWAKNNIKSYSYESRTELRTFWEEKKEWKNKRKIERDKKIVRGERGRKIDGEIEKENKVETEIQIEI